MQSRSPRLDPVAAQQQQSRITLSTPSVDHANVKDFSFLNWKILSFLLTAFSLTSFAFIYRAAKTPLLKYSSPHTGEDYQWHINGCWFLGAPIDGQSMTRFCQSNAPVYYLLVALALEIAAAVPCCLLLLQWIFYALFSIKSYVGWSRIPSLLNVFMRVGIVAFLILALVLHQKQFDDYMSWSTRGPGWYFIVFAIVLNFLAIIGASVLFSREIHIGEYMIPETDHIPLPKDEYVAEASHTTDRTAVPLEILGENAFPE